MIGLPASIGLSKTHTASTPVLPADVIVDLPLNGSFSDNTIRAWLTEEVDMVSFVPSGYAGLQALSVDNVTASASGLTFGVTSVVAEEDELSGSCCIEFFVKHSTAPGMILLGSWGPTDDISTNNLLVEYNLEGRSTNVILRVVGMFEFGVWPLVIPPSELAKPFSHIAITADFTSGQVYRVFIGGTLAYSETVTPYAWTPVKDRLFIGCMRESVLPSRASIISHLRITKNDPVYTTAFTPPTLPSPY